MHTYKKFLKFAIELKTKLSQLKIDSDMNEEWKDVIHFEDLYEISNLGNIKSKRKGLLKTKLNKGGYLYIQLYNKTFMKSYLIHRLVALHFVENDDFYNKVFVNHKDGIKTNNIHTNLIWCTHQENMEHAVKENLIKRGDKNPLKGNKNACKKK